MTQQPPPYAWPPPTSAPWGPPVGPPPRAPRRTGALVVGIAALALLVADAGGAIAVSHHHRSAPAAGTLAADVPALERFVAQDRGLAYTHPVKVIVMSRSALTAYIDKNEGVSDVDSAEAAMYQALGLIDSASAYVQHLKSSRAPTSTGSTRTAPTPSGSRRGERPVHPVRWWSTSSRTPSTTSTSRCRRCRTPRFDAAGDIAAGDDTAFGGSPLPDLVSGIDGLLEGDAERVRDDYLAQLSRPDTRAEQDEELAAGDSVPFDDDDETLAPLTYLPYVDGVTYTRALLKAGGQARLDATFATPPTTSRQILDPGAPAPTASAALPATPAGKVLATGSLGEAGSRSCSTRSTTAVTWLRVWPPRGVRTASRWPPTAGRPAPTGISPSTGRRRRWSLPYRRRCRTRPISPTTSGLTLASCRTPPSA